mgnify:CR=1 FL=1
MLGLTGFLGLTRISLCFWAHTDLTDPTVLLCGWEISQMFLRVGWLARIYFSDPSDKSDLSDLSDKLDIFKNNP